MPLHSLLNATDFELYPTTCGFSTLQLSGGWSAWADSIRLDDVLVETDGHCLLHGCFGWTAPPKVIGQYPSGANVLSGMMTARELDKVFINKLTGESFLKTFQHRGQLWRNMMAMVGVPLKDDRDANKELRDCSIIPIYDAQGAVAKGGVTEESMAGTIAYGYEPGGMDATLVGGKTYTVSQVYHARRFQPTRNDIVVIEGIHDPELRFATAAWWAGKGFSVCCWCLVEPDKKWGQGANLSLRQVEILKGLAR